MQCDGCASVEAVNRCPCGSAIYCSVNCQTGAWPLHSLLHLTTAELVSHLPSIGVRQLDEGRLYDSLLKDYFESAGQIFARQPDDTALVARQKKFHRVFVHCGAALLERIMEQAWAGTDPYTYPVRGERSLARHFHSKIYIAALLWVELWKLPSPQASVELAYALEQPIVELLSIKDATVYGALLSSTMRKTIERNTNYGKDLPAENDPAVRAIQLRYAQASFAPSVWRAKLKQTLARLDPQYAPIYIGLKLAFGELVQALLFALLVAHSPRYTVAFRNELSPSAVIQQIVELRFFLLPAFARLAGGLFSMEQRRVR